eukprot:UN4729
MRLAASTDVKPSKRGVPQANPKVHYSEGPRRDHYPDSSRQRMYSDGPGSEVKSCNSAKRPSKAPISEEELQKRQKRALRFGEVQAASGVEEKSQPAAELDEKAPESATPPPEPAASGTETSKPGSPGPGDGDPAGGKSDAAPDQA